MNIAVAPSAPPNGIAPLIAPDVVVDGQPSDALRLVRLNCEGPFDRRAATLSVAPTAGALAAGADHWLGRRIAAALPMRFADQPDAWFPLFDGRVTSARRSLAADASALTLIADCRWSQALDAPMAEPIDAGSLASVVDALSGRIGMEVATDALAGDVREAGVGPIPRGRTPAEALDAICESFGMFIERTAEWAAGGIVERFALLPNAGGRPVRLGLRDAPTASSLVTLETGGGPGLPRALRAEAPGKVVESTFDLLPAWDPAKENHPDSAYARSSADDFESVRDVFRLWLLNEDASLAAPAFDLTALFNAGRFIPPRPLPFGRALTQDGAGNRLPPRVEYSVDGGATWRVPPGAVRTLDGRAGVYLDSDELPAGFIDAARSGQASVRVTATLRSPRPLVAERWVGNPFAAPIARRTHHPRESFAHRVVLPSSRFHAEIRASERTADTADDREALAAWLLRRGERVGAEGRDAALRAASIQPALRIGDRLERIEGEAAGPDAAPGATDRWDNRRIVRLEHRWDEASTVIHLAAPEAAP